MPNKLKNILDEYAQGILQIIGNDLDQIILYGSYARGEESDNGEISDIDLMILVKVTDNEIKKIEKAVLDYSYEMDLKYDVLLSPIIENVDVFYKRAQYMSFYKNVMAEGVQLNG